jgi:hypothetical protein
MVAIAMSDTGHIPGETPGEPAGGPPGLPPTPSRRSGWMTALMVVAGVILLLPGLCAIIFTSIALSQPGSGGGFFPFVAVGFVVGFFGLIMIWTAFRSPGP